MQTINGTFIKALPIIEGDGRRGHWVRGGFLIKFGEEYQRQVAFSLFVEDKVNMVSAIMPNTYVQVNYQPESREFEGRWYTELRCFSITPLIAAPQPKYPYAQ